MEPKLNNTVYQIVPRVCPTCSKSASIIDSKNEPMAALYNISSELSIPMRSCSTCGLVFFDLIKGFNTFGEIYNHMSKPLSPSEIQPRHNTFAKLILRQKASAESDHLRILELGSGQSQLAQKLAQTGCWVTAVDLSQNSRTEMFPFGGKLSQYQANLANLKKADFPPNSFDWVIMDNVLEHLPEYNNILDCAYHWLDPKLGYFLISVPNAKSLKRLISNAYCNKHLYRPIEHVNMFSAKSLNFLLKKHGFHTESCFFFPRNVMDINVFLSMNFYPLLGIYKLYKKN